MHMGVFECSVPRIDSNFCGDEVLLFGDGIVRVLNRGEELVSETTKRSPIFRSRVHRMGILFIESARLSLIHHPTDGLVPAILMEIGVGSQLWCWSHSTHAGCSAEEISRAAFKI